MRKQTIFLASFFALLFLASCNLLIGQTSPNNNEINEPVTPLAEEEVEPQPGEPSLEENLEPTDTPESVQPPAQEEPQLPPAPVQEYIYPQNVIAPLSAGSDITISYIEMIDTPNGWAVGGTDFEGDHILRTGDGGLTWQDVTPAEVPASGDVAGKSAVAFFQDSQIAWVIYYNLGGASIPVQPVVWSTNDGGANWTPSAVLNVSMASFFSPVALWFDASAVGWLLVEVDAGMSKSYAFLYQSLDGGYLWEAIASPTIVPAEGSDGIQSCGKSELIFADILNGWMLRECPGLYSFNFVDKTTDGGSSWNMIELPPVPDAEVASNGFCTPFDLNVFSADSLKVSLHCQDFSSDEPEDFYYLYSTSDGGVQWNVFELPAMDASFLNETIGWSLGRDMYQTNDGGATWELVKTVIWDGQFSLVDANNWWAVARDGDNIELVYSSDGGKTWQIIEPVIGK
ncbi:MAG: hypothetical protein DWQ07_01115 [Chloroflexi bacterium]|nr:MAG: hypothetical protein DWQ07_01115 [Chloroflexota bacterium]MBL1196517.1 hypothetical protein [Chloroflexota bacterium]NOH13813.1 hypothetical protein [Chloroflexota bacterium]